MPEIRVMIERCVRCGDCLDLCPQSGKETVRPVLERSIQGDIQVTNRESCISCYTCVEYCRAAAIVISRDFSKDDQPDVFPERPVSRII